MFWQNRGREGASATSEPTAELDAADLARGREALARTLARRPRTHARICWAARSDIGRVRENNEDKFDFFLPDDAPTLAAKGRLWAVADGMGGHNAGQIASEAALKTIVRAYFAEEGAAFGDVAGALCAAFAQANDLISAAAAGFPDRSGMGTTATVAAILEDRLTIAHVGDSRAYLLRRGRLRQLTDDHSWVEEQVRRGGLSREAALQSPYRNVITRSIGMGPALEADIVVERLETGDLILLCTDGLTGYLDDPALVRHLDAGGAAAVALRLVDAANDAGGRDNITVLLLSVRGIAPFEEDHVAG